jgi:hypothetical protein
VNCSGASGDETSEHEHPALIVSGSDLGRLVAENLPVAVLELDQGAFVTRAETQLDLLCGNGVASGVPREDHLLDRFDAPVVPKRIDLQNAEIPNNPTTRHGYCPYKYASFKRPTEPVAVFFSGKEVVRRAAS